MRAVILTLVVAVLSSAVAAGATYRAMESRVQRAEITSFNEGFQDGACFQGADGFGNPCLAN